MQTITVPRTTISNSNIPQSHTQSNDFNLEFHARRRRHRMGACRMTRVRGMGMRCRCGNKFARRSRCR